MSSPDMSIIIHATNQDCIPILTEEIQRIKIGIKVATCLSLPYTTLLRMEGHLKCMEPGFIAYYTIHEPSNACDVFRKCVLTSSTTDASTNIETCYIMCPENLEANTVYLEWSTLDWMEGHENPCLYSVTVY